MISKLLKSLKRQMMCMMMSMVTKYLLMSSASS